MSECCERSKLPRALDGLGVPPGIESLEVEHRKHCPACLGSRHDRVGQDASPTTVRMEGKYYALAGYHIRQCMDCGLYFKSTRMAASALERYYAGLDSGVFDLDLDFPTDREARKLLAALPATGRVLDFGCSTGRMLHGETARLECLGIEPNLIAAASARRRGIQVLTEQEADASLTGTCDMVLLADVFEHLPAPTALVGRLSAMLKSGGDLVIITGNADAITSRNWIGEHWYFRLEGHLQMMSELHAAWLAARSGLEIVSLKCCSHYRTSIAQRLKQHTQSFTYHQFKRSQDGAFSTLLRHMPILRRAESWPNAPTLSCAADHFVLVLRKS